MGFTELLTIIFVVLKLIGTIDWSWWLVVLPEIIAVAFYMLIEIAYLISVRQMVKKERERVNRFLKEQ